jgi:hypothetical protein
MAEHRAEGISIETRSLHANAVSALNPAVPDGRIASLQALRGVAALLVLAHHTAPYNISRNNAI